MERTEVAVIGTGLVGSAIAWELSSRGAQVTVLEVHDEPAAGVSGTNSGLLCTGFDAEPGSLECRLIRAQARRWQRVFGELGIPYMTPGALVLARSPEETQNLERLARNAATNGVKTRLLDAAQVADLQPGLDIEAALQVPDESITDPYEVVIGLLSKVADVRFGWAVDEVASRPDGALIAGGQARLAADFVINCAGLHADDIAADGSFQVTPRRGEFLAYGPATGELLSSILLPLPTEHSKGVLVFPTIHGGLIAGPTAIDQRDKDDWRPRPEALREVRRKAASILPALDGHDPVAAWAGLRTVGRPSDYVVAWSRRVPRMLNVAGIRSTGLSSCLGLSEYAVAMLGQAGLPSLRAGASGNRGGRARTAFAGATSAAWRKDPNRALRPWWERLPQSRQLDPNIVNIL